MERWSLKKYRQEMQLEPAYESAEKKPKRKTKKEEANIQAGICEVFDLRGVVYSVTDAARVWGPDGKPRPSKVRKGWPDLTTVLGPKGRMVCFETKTPIGSLSPDQKHIHALIRSRGGLVFIPRSIDEALKQLDSVTPFESDNDN